MGTFHSTPRGTQCQRTHQCSWFANRYLRIISLDNLSIPLLSCCSQKSSYAQDPAEECRHNPLPERKTVQPVCHNHTELKGRSKTLLSPADVFSLHSQPRGSHGVPFFLWGLSFFTPYPKLPGSSLKGWLNSLLSVVRVHLSVPHSSEWNDPNTTFGPSLIAYFQRVTMIKILAS